MPNDMEERLIRLMTDHGTDIKRLCRCLLNDAQLAEDAAQETFVKAWRALPSFRGECSEKTWLCRIAVTTCRSMQRGFWMRRLDRRLTPEDLPRQAAQPQPEDSPLWEAVQALPMDLKRAVLLRYYEEFSLKEAAQALGVGVNTLNTRLRKARKLLKDKLEEDWDAE